MVTDTPEFQQRIGLLGVRVDTSPTGMRKSTVVYVDMMINTYHLTF